MTTATATMTITGTTTATIPPPTPTPAAAVPPAVPTPAPAVSTPAPAVPAPASDRWGPTAEQDCSMCSGIGGKFVTTDGRSPREALDDWVPCTGCNGTGKVRDK
ncbi:hypothetical protein ACIRPH_18470 [Nocardiopsis sp. NPDC101807]|uniref:hypothetical protein n=1 Tax=Nocardiopsis sp. NPDC101807 TaxID=3364339 RepID=UPI003822198E